MIDVNKVKTAIKELVDSFKINANDYISKKSDYLEDEVRTEYIDRLFEALGWDMGNKNGLREVRRGNGPTKKRPDYTFRIPHSSGNNVVPVFLSKLKHQRKIWII